MGSASGSAISPAGWLWLKLAQAKAIMRAHAAADPDIRGSFCCSNKRMVLKHGLSLLGLGESGCVLLGVTVKNYSLQILNGMCGGHLFIFEGTKNDRTMEKDDVKRVYDTLLCSLGMNQLVKIDLKVQRKTILLLSQVIRKGLAVKDNKEFYGLPDFADKQNIQELEEISSSCLQKAELQELSGKLLELAIS